MDQPSKLYFRQPLSDLYYTGITTNSYITRYWLMLVMKINHLYHKKQNETVCCILFENSIANVNRPTSFRNLRYIFWNIRKTWDNIGWIFASSSDLTYDLCWIWNIVTFCTFSKNSFTIFISFFIMLTLLLVSIKHDKSMQAHAHACVSYKRAEM